MARIVEIPYAPRDCFLPFHNRTQRWAIIVAHRRAGKTVACINDLIKRAITEGSNGDLYAYIAPYYSQAKAVAWQYLLKYSEPIRRRENASELWVELLNGARIRLFGADNENAMRGLSLSGVVADEVADWKPTVFGSVLRPALADKQGWCAFIGTPKGHNEFYRLWTNAEGKGWFSALLKASETGLLPGSELLDARAGMTEDQYAQEFECSFEAAIKGAIFAEELKKAHITKVPHAPELPVETWWDLGVSDSTAIIFTQTLGREIRVIDYYEAQGEGLPHYAKVLDGKGYNYKSHNAPHDIQVRELGSGRSRIETAASLGIRFNVVANIPLHDGINAARLLLSRCYIDTEQCRPLIEALQNYRWDYNEKLGEFKSRPLHDWASHACDAFRYLAVGHRDKLDKPRNRPIVAAGWMG